MDYFDETIAHIEEVQRNMYLIASELEMRSKTHDESKLNEPEASSFAALTPLLKKSTYGSNEYNAFLNELKDTLKHHYSMNRHHPEHFKNGISGMNIIDLIEMFCDWLAATKRHNDGDIYKSIEINKSRFNLSDELVSIFINTAKQVFEEKLSS
jgi:hypothetical protein